MQWRTSQKQQSLRHLACLNICSPFGLSNAAQMSQCMMDHMLNDLEAVFASMEASRVGSLERQTHLIHLEAFFTPWLPVALPSIWKNIFLKFELWKFSAARFQWQVRPPTAEHTAPIASCLPPQDIKQLQRFLNMVNFYRHYLPGCAHSLRP